MTAKSKTQYEALLEMAEKAGDLHPHSYVVIDSKTQKLLGSGTDPVKVYEKVREHLKSDQVPLIYKKPKKNEILIL